MCRKCVTTHQRNTSSPLRGRWRHLSPLVSQAESLLLIYSKSRKNCHCANIVPHISWWFKLSLFCNVTVSVNSTVYLHWNRKVQNQDINDPLAANDCQKIKLNNHRLPLKPKALNHWFFHMLSQHLHMLLTQFECECVYAIAHSCEITSQIFSTSEIIYLFNLLP